MKQKIPHYGIWFIRGQGGRADEDSLVLLPPPTSHIIVDPKDGCRYVDMWIFSVTRYAQSWQKFAL